MNLNRASLQLMTKQVTEDTIANASFDELMILADIVDDKYMGDMHAACMTHPRVLEKLYPRLSPLERATSTSVTMVLLMLRATFEDVDVKMESIQYCSMDVSECAVNTMTKDQIVDNIETILCHSPSQSIYRIRSTSLFKHVPPPLYTTLVEYDDKEINDKILESNNIEAMATLAQNCGDEETYVLLDKESSYIRDVIIRRDIPKYNDILMDGDEYDRAALASYGSRATQLLLRDDDSLIVLRSLIEHGEEGIRTYVYFNNRDHAVIIRLMAEHTSTLEIYKELMTNKHLELPLLRNENHGHLVYESCMHSDSILVLAVLIEKLDVRGLIKLRMLVPAQLSNAITNTPIMVEYQRNISAATSAASRKS